MPLLHAFRYSLAVTLLCSLPGCLPELPGDSEVQEEPSCEHPASGEDLDSDGFAAGLGCDCDDADAGVNPDAVETCDGKDQDCNGLADDGATDGQTWFVDADGDGVGDDATAVVQCDAPAQGVLDGGDCDDTNPDVNPSAVEDCDGVDSNCTGDESDASDSRTFYTDADRDGYGDATAPVQGCEQSLPEGVVYDNTDCDDAISTTNPGVEGEVCNNGTDDDCDGTAGECARGGPLLADASILPSADGGVVFEVALGDVTGDGVADIVLGAPYAEGESGQVAIYAGPLLGTATEPVILLEGEDPGDHAGYELAADGDVDGDGIDDLLIGAPGRDDSGQAYLYYGGSIPASSGLGTANVKLVGEAAGDELSVGADEGAKHPPTMDGDLDGDGVQDILIGSRRNDGAGAAYLVTHPSGTEDMADATAKFTGELAGDEAGTSLAFIGDVNDDGFDDFAVSAPEHSGWGTVYVTRGGSSFNGTYTLANSDASWSGTVADQRLGYSVRGLGDVTGDGTPDVGIGTLAGVGGWIVDGSLRGGMSVTAAEISVTPDSVGFAGHSFASLDFDHDGTNDVTVCGTNIEFLLYGPLVEREYAIAGDTAGYTNDIGCGAVTGDVNGDGFPDLVTFDSYGYSDVHAYFGRGA